MKKIAMMALVLTTATAQAGIITNFWADFEGSSDWHATENNLNSGTVVGSWTEEERAASRIQETSDDTKYKWFFPRSQENDPAYEFIAHFDTAAPLADGVEWSFMARAQNALDSVDELERGRNFVELRDSENNAVLTLAFAGVNDQGDNHFSRMEYNVGNGWVVVSDDLQLPRWQSDLVYDVDWNHVKLTLNEQSFSILLADTGSGALETVVDDVVWNRTGMEIDRIVFYTSETTEESVGRRTRYDDILVTTIPEPGTVALLALGVWGLIGWRRLQA